ncbi:alpha-L-arabinofuranosidase C-terminal domain-containing protein [Glycomyces tritici]|uniref:non-reducing end alpha-L-arabinofuranosidase n=1 Tax=Glycomyces tritici TaxID=2665176 RepID=A0ABT7YL01_9ACTN|nr:alpha-L-arabinofuranosidase C-terminal domain-containing protein [Glycomyces tritici]MDN3239281.1 alpha-L-arabinofuranosidase C-terminal domain-containing protein [Glycomyces tritici]
MKPPTRTRTTTVVAATAVVLATLTATNASAQEADASIHVDLDAATAISDELYGLFYEDINHAADGGLYAELVQNRSFEFSPADEGSYHPLTSWTVNGEAAVADSGGLHENNVHYLAAEAGTTIINAGYNSGMAIEAGKPYDFSVWARAGQNANITVQLLDADGTPVSGTATVNTGAGTWTELSTVLNAGASTVDGRLAVTTDAAADLDMVSLFPRDTFKGRDNGLRKDLAELIADLDPSFLRFPGGCIVNTGNFDRDGRERAYNWKDTVGPVEERLTNQNFWGYNQTYGLGYYEYFQFAEDIGAQPLPVVPVGVTGCGDSAEITDPAELQTWVQDTLDLIEFANGPADSEWGSLRAEMGHPEPFGLTKIGLGNEEYKDQFYANFPAFKDAVRAAYPDIEIVGNSGVDDAGAVFDRSWEFMREQQVDLVDEHYYNSPEWFFANNARYDAYDRTGPHVFVGEYASRSNTWWSALSEASYLTGIERNGDVVDMASYAPLLSNIDYIDWAPDMIWYDNHQTVTSASYEVQKLFATNAGDEVLASTLDASPIAQPDIAGGIGLATWNTAATYDDVKVTAAGGTELFADDFATGSDGWTVGGNAAGTWSATDGAYSQTALVEDARTTAGAADWSNYTYEVKATKTAGSEGFLVMFGVEGSDDYYWWNLGGWNNTTSAVEKSSNGAKSTLLNHDTVIETGRTYDLKIEVEGRTITGYVDGEQAFTVEDKEAVEPLYQVVTRDEDTGEVTLKVVNAQSEAVTTGVVLEGQRLKSKGEVTTIACEPGCDNMLGQDQVVYPETETVKGLGNEFTYEFAPYSVTFITLKPQGRH